MKSRSQNPNTEGRSPKEARMPKSEMPPRRALAGSTVGFRASFGFRHLAFGFALLFTSLVHAQQYSIDWSTIASGGNTSTGAAYSITGTIGQPDAGTMSAGNYALTGGFWSFLSVVQTPGAPLLSLSLTATNTAVISWPSPSAGFALEQTPALDTPAWTAVTNIVQTDGSLNWVVVPASAGNKFFRLKK